MNHCKNCNEQITGNFCSNCGQPAEQKRIDKYYILQELKDFFGGNKGYLYTIKKLLTSPGDSVREFLSEDRYRFVKPITFVVITSLVYALFNHFFQISVKDYGLQKDVFAEESMVTTIFNWMIIDYPGYSTVITGLLVAFFLKLFFRKSGYNLFEIFILMCFVSGVSSLIMAVVTVFQGLLHVDIIQLSNLILIAYFVWAIGQFFDKKKVGSYVKALLSYFICVFVLAIAIVFVGTLIDVLSGTIVLQ